MPPTDLDGHLSMLAGDSSMAPMHKKEIGWPRLQEYMRRAALAILASRGSSDTRQQQRVIDTVRATLDDALCAMSWPPHVISKVINRQLANRLKGHTMVRDLSYYARSVAILRVGRPQGHLLGAPTADHGASFRFDPSSSSSSGESSTPSSDISSSGSSSSSGVRSGRRDRAGARAGARDASRRAGLPSRSSADASSTDSDGDSMGSAEEAIGFIDEIPSTAVGLVSDQGSAIGDASSAGALRPPGASPDAGKPPEKSIDSNPDESQAAQDVIALKKRKAARRKRRRLREAERPDPMQDGPSKLTVVSCFYSHPYSSFICSLLFFACICVPYGSLHVGLSAPHPFAQYLNAGWACCL